MSPPARPANGNLWRILAGVIGLLAVTFTVMGIFLRVHAAQPHDAAVSESEFQIFIQQDIEQMRAVREDLREIRECMQRLTERESGRRVEEATTPR
jgi:hypothetical protein